MIKLFVAALVSASLPIGQAQAAASVDCIKYIPDNWHITEGVKIEMDAVIKNECALPHRLRINFALHEYHEHGKVAARDSILVGNGIEATVLRPGEAFPVHALFVIDGFMITQKPYVNGLFATHEIEFVDSER